MSIDPIQEMLMPEVLRAEVINLSEDTRGEFIIDVRCPHCHSLHQHNEKAADLYELQRLMSQRQDALCGRLDRKIMGLPLYEDSLGYSFVGLDRLTKRGLRVDIARADPIATMLSESYGPEERIEKALELIDSAPGLTGFDMEYSSLGHLAMLVRHEIDGARERFLIFSLEATDGRTELVLQRHQMIEGRYRHDDRESVWTMDDPSLLLLGVYAWLRTS